ncbi:hypothetical protein YASMINEVIRUS_1573 [Yasminevirus sp. GU-2018]|uniref:Uncharacterized protein n=1 Tax=Yasminevirus sp. GU-2018 TaxID=2420051 RepID=A0A5K0UBC1_9VIRU|nr:hypothetical protein YASMINEVIRUS_1573 [Yasminevirus sp. GU-2018]
MSGSNQTKFIGEKALRPKEPLTPRSSSDSVENKDEIFHEIDKALNRPGPASVEYLVARPHSGFTFFGMGFNFNWYGHGAVVYTMPDGTRKVFNIVGGKPIGGIVEQHTPEEYLFTRNSDQGGVYNREFIGIRVQNVPSESIVKMDAKFEEIKRTSEVGNAKFDIFMGPIYNTFKHFFPGMAERGNCARWASVGLMEAGLLTRKTMWPKSIFIDMFENTKHTNAKSYDNLDVVSYRCMYHVEKDYGKNAKNPIELVSPLQFFRNLFYRDLRAFAHAEVSVPEGSNRAIVVPIDRSLAKKPSALRNNTINNPYFVVATSITSLYLIKRYPARWAFNATKNAYSRVRNYWSRMANQSK